jgi:voltage-gated potassium channel
LIRVLRILRLVRALRATHRLSGILFRDKIRGGFASVFLSFLLLVMFSSVGILLCEEPDPNANIRTAGDSLWWSISTLTTLGGSNLHPVTTEGRVLAMALTICGMGMFGAISGMVASVLLGQQKKDADINAEILDQLKRLETKMDALQRQEKPPSSPPPPTSA